MDTFSSPPARPKTMAERMQPVWDELAALVYRAQRGGVRRLSADELSRMDRLYRLSTNHLAQLQSRGANPSLVHNLNRLVAKAHSVIYVSPKPQMFRRILMFYATGFSRSIARIWPYQLASLALFLAGTIGGYAATMHSPLAAYALVIPDEMRMPGASAEQLVSVMRSGRDHSQGEKFAFMSFLLTHNTKVGFTAFAGGVMAGIPTIYLMLYTGSFLGAFTAIHANNGVAGEWWAWILPHGVTELGACILCGGAGLLLGMAVLRPGHRSRMASLVAAGKEGINVAMGIIPMFVFAGFAESFVRQSHMTTEERYMFAAATALFWVCYFGLGAYLEWRVTRPARVAEGITL